VLQIREAFFNHLFRPLEDYRNMTAFEVQERMTNDLNLLVPFVARYIDEKVTPTMKDVFAIAAMSGKLPAPPPELEAEGKVNFDIDYVGRLALVSKNFETMGSVNAIRILGEASQMAPQLMQWFDNLDADKFGNDLWYSQGGAMNALKPADQVDAERQAREAQMQQQQAIDNLAPVADATQKLSGAVDPQSPLAQMAE
jgi:hypothetical protein